jgi:ABC-type antimicrobial peptide transport system permease subunit
MRRAILLAITSFFIITGNISAQDKQDNLSPQRKQAIDSLALEKVKDLSKYISIIGDKKTPWSEAQRVIERAVELFMEGSEIGVSSLSSPDVNNYKVRAYFDRLMQLNYDKVNIDWYKIQYVSDLERQPDGTYVGVITIYQRFQGFDKEKGLIYEDTTKKDITVYVKRKETQIGGRLIGFWDVLLGDIRVKETSK